MEKKIPAQAQKKKKSTKKNTSSGVKSEKEDLTLYKKTKQNDVDILRDPALNPKTNRWKLQKKFLDEYTGFFRLFRNTLDFIDEKKFNKFLMNREFTMSLDMIKLKQKHLRKLQTEDSLSQAWFQYMESVKDVIDNTDPAFEKVIRQYFMKSNKKIKDVLDSIQEHDNKKGLSEPFYSGSIKY